MKPKGVGPEAGKLDVPQGTLELMILTILAREPLHGYGLTQRLTTHSRDRFHVNPGSLFPSLYRLEQEGMLRSEWRATANHRQAKYYRLTPAGRKYLDVQRRRYEQVTIAVAGVLDHA